MACAAVEAPCKCSSTCETVARATFSLSVPSTSRSWVRERITDSSVTSPCDHDSTKNIVRALL
eukprot:6205674-Pleurochrysis_carterae.AAC.3